MATDKQVLPNFTCCNMLSALRADAWWADECKQVVGNVISVAKQWKTELSVTLFMLECGSAYHEWQVMLALKSVGFKIERLVLMDSAIQPTHRCYWERLARIHGVELVVADATGSNLAVKAGSVTEI